jgi:hypothetical protein
MANRTFPSAGRLGGANMRTLKYSTKRIGTVVLGLSFYALSIVQCASQTSDSVSIPRAAWEQLESAIHGVAEAMKAISSAQTPTPTQKIQPTSQPPCVLDRGIDRNWLDNKCAKLDESAAQASVVQPADGQAPPSTATSELAQVPDPPVTTSQVYRGCCEPHRDRDCCERPRDRDCCEPHRDRDCCEPHRYRGCCEPRRNRDCCGEMDRREPLVWRAPPCDYCDRRELDDQF